jgi:hypothetical protein
MPSEGKSFSRKYKTRFNGLLKTLRMSNKEYRIRLSVLRKYLDLPEHHLCSGKIHRINPSKLSFGAQTLYEKALRNKNPWDFPSSQLTDESVPFSIQPPIQPPIQTSPPKKNKYIKNSDEYNNIINNLKL